MGVGLVLENRGDKVRCESRGGLGQDLSRIERRKKWGNAVTWFGTRGGVCGGGGKTREAESG